jgi:TonB family protein
MPACSLVAALSVLAVTSMSAAIQEATPVTQVAPAYSRDLRASCVEGDVVVSFTVTKTGDVLNPKVVSSTDQLLEKPTLAAIRKWKFAPARSGGVAVSATVVQPVHFSIPELHPDNAVRLVVSNSKAGSRSGNSTSAN